MTTGDSRSTRQLSELMEDLTAARIGYLDNINQAGLLQVTAARAALLDQITALRLAELDAANMPADLDATLAAAVAAAAYAIVNSGLSFRALVSSKVGCGVNDFICGTLADVGTGAFYDASAPYRCFVFMKGDGSTTSPHGETQNVTAYVTASGKFTTAAFGAEVVVGDTVIIMHPRLAELAAILALVTTMDGRITAARAGYIDNINQAGLLQITATRGGYLDNINQTGLLTYTSTRSAYIDELAAANIPADVDSILARVLITSAGTLNIKATQIDLNQVAGTYTLFTSSINDVVLEKLLIRMSGGTVTSAALTSITIQSNDATPFVFVNSTQGAVGNLLNKAQLSWSGQMLLDVGDGANIGLTINGASSGLAKVCDVVAEYRAVSNGGTLV